MRRSFIILVLGSLLLAGCNNKSTETGSTTIAVSILPQEYFVTRIAGDLFSINIMIPPGASPATYEPTPAQLSSLSSTSLYMKMGYTGFEMAWMEKLVSVNQEMKVVNLSGGVDLIMEGTMQDHDHAAGGHHHGGIDPHTWLSPVNAKIISRNIHEALVAEFPEHRETFDTNLASFLSELDSLDMLIREELEGLSSRDFFTYHPSLSYFARDYDLVQHPLELGGKTPSASHMKKLVDMGRSHDIGVVFLQMQFDQKNAEVLAREIDAEIVQINPLDPEWYAQMLFIAAKLKENLQ